MWNTVSSGFRPVLMLFTFLYAGMMSDQSLAQEKPQVVGYLEQVLVNGNIMEFVAKIDTGADHSSLHVKKYRLFKKGSERWVRFTLVDRNGKQEILERPMVRYSYVKRKMLPPQKRPVVVMRICLANVARQANVSLVDRSGFRVPVLIGRSFLKDDFVVDPAHTYRTKPVCKQGI